MKRCLEIVCLTTSPADREAVIAAVAPFSNEDGVDVRIYRHETHPTDLAVHLMHPVDARDRAEALGERITALLEAHGIISRARWREVDRADRGGTA